MFDYIINLTTSFNDIPSPFFSIIIPAYNAGELIKRSVGSVQKQTFDDFEVIVVDDKSKDSTVKIVGKIVGKDSRVSLLVQDENQGTLAARARGIAAAKGKYILLLDQDDELKPDTLQKVKDALGKESVDILHFGVEVVAESEGAKVAAKDCEGWLNPKPRRLEGEQILDAQFCENDNFDWLVHHKVFRSGLAKKAWGTVFDIRLCTADDFLMSYILCSLASTYVALPDSKWYIYHLGAGETFAKGYTVKKWKRICDADALAFQLINNGSREKVIQSCQSKLIEHVMNEMHDNLSGKEVDECIDYALKKWDADAVAGELWRFVRDRAYAQKNDRTLKTCVKQARYADSFVRKSNNERYLKMKEIANVHLKDLEGSTLRQRLKAIVRKG